MIKFLMFILLGFVGYSMLNAIINPKPKGKIPRNRSREGEQMVEDPHCGTFLPISDAVTASIHGELKHFCSKKCLKAYRKANK